MQIFLHLCKNKQTKKKQQACLKWIKEEEKEQEDQRLWFMQGGGRAGALRTGTHLHLVQLRLDVWRKVCGSAAEGVERLGTKQVFTWRRHTGSWSQAAAAPYRADGAASCGWTERLICCPMGQFSAFNICNSYQKKSVFLWLFVTCKQYNLKKINSDVKDVFG